MNEAQDIIIRLKAIMELSRKESGLKLGKSEKMTLSAASECPLGLCDGSGVIYDALGLNAKPCECVKLLNKQNRLKFAAVPEEFRELKVGEFDTEIYSGDDDKSAARSAKKWAIEYVKRFDMFRTDGKGLYFYSSGKGSGKTRLMISVGNALINMYGVSVRFITANDLLDNIRFSFNKSKEEGEKDTYEALMRDFKAIDVLLLDDVGAERPSDWVNEVFYNILNDRMTHKKPTLFTSNYPLESLPYNGRITDRIFKMAVPVKMPEESVRAKKAAEENEKYLKMIMEG